MLGGTTLEINDANTGGKTSGKVNVIPPVARANGDLRTLNNEQTERVVAKMKAIVAAHVPRTGATLTIEASYPAMQESEGSRDLVRQLNAVNADARLPVTTLADVMNGGGDIASWRRSSDSSVSVLRHRDSLGQRNRLPDSYPTRPSEWRF
jgi:glutamate carboxypeptidase